MNRLTENQRHLINKVSVNDSFLYELTEYVIDKNQEYSQVLMQRDGVGNLSTLYTYGNQRINSESYNNLSGLYTYDGRGSVSAVIGTWGDHRATYWYDGLGNVKSQIHGYGAFGRGKRYFGYNAEQYNPVTGNQNLRARQVNIRRQRFLSEDTYLGSFTETLSINRYIYGNDNPLKFKDPSGFMSDVIMTKASKTGPGISGCGGGSQGLVSNGMILTTSTLLYGPGVNSNIQQAFKDTIIHGFTGTDIDVQTLRNARIDLMIASAKGQANRAVASVYWERGYKDLENSIDTNSNDTGEWKDNDVEYNDWYWGNSVSGTQYGWCTIYIIYNASYADLTDINHDNIEVKVKTSILPSKDEAKKFGLQESKNLKTWYESQGRYHSIEEVNAGTYIPKKGDVFFKNTRGYDLHSGFVTEYDTDDMKVSTVDGNTTDTKESNIGYGVFEHKRREVKNYIGFGDNFYTGGGAQ